MPRAGAGLARGSAPREIRPRALTPGLRPAVTLQARCTAGQDPAKEKREEPASGAHGRPAAHAGAPGERHTGLTAPGPGPARTPGCACI